MIYSELTRPRTPIRSRTTIESRIAPMQDPSKMNAPACSTESAAAQQNPGLPAHVQNKNVAHCGTPDDPTTPTSHPSASAGDPDAPPALTVDTYAARYESLGIPAASPPAANPAADLAPDPDPAPAAAALQPLRYRIWERYCAGESRSAIARAFHLDRETVTRHIRAVEALLAEEHQLEASIAFWRAVEALLTIQSSAWAAYAAETAREDQAFAERDHNATPRVRYRAQRARLLTIASDAAWQAGVCSDQCESCSDAACNVEKRAAQGAGVRTIMRAMDVIPNLSSPHRWTSWPTGP